MIQFCTGELECVGTHEHIHSCAVMLTVASCVVINFEVGVALETGLSRCI